MNNCKRCKALVPAPTKPLCIKCGKETPWEYSTGQPMCIDCIIEADRDVSAELGED